MQNTRQATVLKRRIFEGSDVSVCVTYYPPGNRMDTHAHDDDQFSILMLGRFQESSDYLDSDLYGYHVGYKPAGYRHCNRYGPDGTLILAVETAPGMIAASRGRWQQTDMRDGTMAIVHSLLQSREDGVREECVTELLTFISDPARVEGGALMDECRAGWLPRVREAIHDAPEKASLKTLCRLEGIHHTHLSRAFAQSYGLPFSVYRRRVMAMRAAQSILSHRRSASEAAYAAGFADQAHMTRVMRRETGFTPRGLQQFFA